MRDSWRFSLQYFVFCIDKNMIDARKKYNQQ